MHALMFSPQTISPRLCTALSLLLLLSGLLLPVRADEIRLPEIGDPSGNIITPVEEQRLGQAFMRSIRSSMKVIDDPLLSSYIESLGRRLVSGSAEANQPFTFFLVDDPQVNAFAGPGGYIGVYTGLITTTQSESELASVIAHEIAHVTQKHLIRTFDAANRMSLPAAALMIAALVVGAAAKSPEATAAAVTGIQAGVIQQQINFTRDHEEEADSIGIRILADADFDTRAMPVFFSRMGKATQIYDSGKLPEFLRTHPVTTNRIADAHARAADYPYRQRADSLEYHLLRATLRVASIANPMDAVTDFRKALEEGRYRNEVGQRYGLALALTAARRFDEADQELEVLLQGHPDQIDFLVLKARLQEKRGQPQAAPRILSEALQQHPGNYVLSIYYAQSLLEQGRPQEAVPILERQVEGRPDDTRLYRLLSRAMGDSGKTSQGHEYLAEYYYHSGNLQSAQQQLEIALRDKTLSYYQSAKMSARLKQIRDELHDQKAREK